MQGALEALATTSNCNCHMLLQIVLFFVCILYSVFVQHDKGGSTTLLITHASLNNLLEWCKHAQNHPNVECTKHPISDEIETRSLSSKNWIIQNIQFQKMHNHPKVDYTNLPSLDDLQACSESSKSGLYKTSKSG